MKNLEKLEKHMKIVIAIDSFKGSLTSMEAGNACAKGIRRVMPDADIVVRPLADGGEGTVDALVTGLHGRYETVVVTGPLGEKVDCRYGTIDSESSVVKDCSKTAVIEMSGAAGITLVKREDLNPLKATTYGVGEVIKDAYAKGCRRFIIGIGGSATNDGGAGMLQALGFKLLDKNGEQITPGAEGLRDIVSVGTRSSDTDMTDERIPGVTFMVACDVDNPLCGSKGCSAVFAPQKGAIQDDGTPDKQMISQMDSYLAHFAEVTKQAFPDADPDYPGSGAAGGLGFAFHTFLNASLESGAKLIIEETHLEDDIQDADLVITGEGRLDAQTAMGKAPIGVAELAKKYGKPVIAFAGSVTDGAKILNSKGIDAFFPMVRGIITLDEAMDPYHAKQNMSDTAEQVIRAVEIFHQNLICHAVI